MENTHPTQVDTTQRAVSQTTQRMVIGSVQQECADSTQQQIKSVTAHDGKQMCASAAATAVECQTVCSRSAEEDVSNQMDSEVLNVQDSREPRTTWQDDEHEYEAQMNLLKYEMKFFFPFELKL